MNRLQLLSGSGPLPVIGLTCLRPTRDICGERRFANRKLETWLQNTVNYNPKLSELLFSAESAENLQQYLLFWL